jgi:hypothetical protein
LGLIFYDGIFVVFRPTSAFGQKRKAFMAFDTHVMRKRCAKKNTQNVSSAGIGILKRPHNFARLILARVKITPLLVTVVTTSVCRLPLSSVPGKSNTLL